MLPLLVQQRLEKLLNGKSLKELGREAQKQQEIYRNRAVKNGLDQDPIGSTDAALAYALTRMPATYGVFQKVLERLLEVGLNMPPQNILDIGSGTGAGLLVFSEFFPNAVLNAVEQNKFMTEFSREILSVQNFTISKDIPNQSFDIISAAYMLNEIQINLETFIEELWHRTGSILILIEAGTPRGFDIILKARNLLLKQGAYILSPCPHVYDCPLINTSRWCHFEERIARSKTHKALTQNATRGFEDEPYSYIIFSKQETSNKNQARLISRVHGEKILSAEVCTPAGQLQKIQATKKDGAVYKNLRRAGWGDLWRG